MDVCLPLACVRVHARARMCVRSPPAAESRERRGTGRVGGEVMSGTRQRPTDEGGREGELSCAALRAATASLSSQIRLV